MDSHIANDPNNPINWNGTNPTCSCCEKELDCFFDYEDICNKCFNKEEDEENEVEN